MAEPHWTTYLAALLTPTIAVLGSFIAYCQWRTAQNKLKLDLFDRKFAVYDAARNLIASIMTSGKAKDEELYKFLSGTRSAKWLLDEDIDNYFEKNYGKRQLNSKPWSQGCKVYQLATSAQTTFAGNQK